jgi:hypothetical protein
MRKPIVVQLALPLIAAAIFILGSSFAARADDTCPPDRPNGPPPNCCPEGTTFREGFCRPISCGPGMTGTPPHCERICPPGTTNVNEECYNPCPPTTIGTPPNCKCPSGQIWDDAAKICKDRPKCTGGMIGTPPNCQCPSGTVLVNGICQGCPSGKVVSDGQCQCPSNSIPNSDGSCRKCKGDLVVRGGECKCPKGTVQFPSDSNDCVKGKRIVCQWRGTAPACDGSCLAGEEFIGSGPSPDSWGGGGAVPGGFGSSCWSGNKAYCCHPSM